MGRWWCKAKPAGKPRMRPNNMQQYVVYIMTATPIMPLTRIIVKIFINITATLHVYACSPGQLSGGGSLSVLWGLASIGGSVTFIQLVSESGVLFSASGAAAASRCAYTNVDIYGLGVSIYTTEIWGE